MDECASYEWVKYTLAPLISLGVAWIIAPRVNKDLKRLELRASLLKELQDQLVTYRKAIEEFSKSPSCTSESWILILSIHKNLRNKCIEVMYYDEYHFKKLINLLESIHDKLTGDMVPKSNTGTFGEFGVQKELGKFFDDADETFFRIRSKVYL